MINEEKDSIKQIEQFKLRIKEKGIVNKSLLKFLGISTDDINLKNKTERKTEDIYQILKEYNILTKKYEFKEFLETISHLWETHQFKKEIKSRIEGLFKILQEDIKNVFSEKEIFLVFRFCNNYYILLILIEQNIITIETIINTLMRFVYDWNIIKYFYQEIRKYDEKCLNQFMITDASNGLKEFVEENDENQEFFYRIRKEGLKESIIIELIKEDKIEEFISFVEQSPIDLNEKLIKEKTLFGTNIGDLTPIELSALFGSGSIFKYLYLKNVNIIIEKHRSNIIEYAIQGRNYEIIHLLEERKEIIKELNKNRLIYLKVSIELHYNEIFEYLITKLNIQITERIINFIIKCRNYHLFNHLVKTNQIELNDRAIISNVFRENCNNGNVDIVKILVNQPNLDINSKDDILIILLK